MRTAREKLEENVFEAEEVMLLEEEAFRESLVGISSNMRAVYDYDKMAEEYAEYHGCSLEDAMDYIDFNVIRSLSYWGQKAPIIMDTFVL